MSNDGSINLSDLTWKDHKFTLIFLGALFLMLLYWCLSMWMQDGRYDNSVRIEREAKEEAREEASRKRVKPTPESSRTCAKCKKALSSSESFMNRHDDNWAVCDVCLHRIQENKKLFTPK